MRIYIKDIGPDGLEVNEAFFAKDLELEELEGATLKAPVEIKGFVQKKGDTVLLDLKAKTIFSFECARCLEPIERKIEKVFDLEYSINRATLFVELNEDLRQELLLSLPDKILCKDSCEGLCISCGANLNIKKCKCHKNSYQVVD